MTPKGQSQAEALADKFRLAGMMGVPIFSSPMRRAIETAQTVALVLNSDVRIAEAFREVNTGSLEGKSDDESWATYETVMEAWLAGDAKRAFPDGEDRDSAVSRMRAGLQLAVDGSRNNRAIVVAHGGLLLGTLVDLCPTYKSQHDLENCGVVELNVNGQDDAITVVGAERN